MKYFYIIICCLFSLRAFADLSPGIFIEHKGVSNCGDPQILRHAQTACKNWADDQETAYHYYVIKDVYYEGESESGKKGWNARWCKYRVTVECEYDRLKK